MVHSLPFPPHSGHPLHVIATSIAELDCIAELIHLYSEFCHYAQTFFFSHTSPIVKLILCPHKLLLWTRAVFLTCLTLSITLSTWQASASTHLTSYSCFHCISEKQEAPVYQHHTFFRASYKAQQKAIRIFPLVLVGFSCKLHSFQGTPHPYTSTTVSIMDLIGYPVKTLHYI